MIYEVWIECLEGCEAYEAKRLHMSTSDSVKAINQSIMLRDLTHLTEIRVKDDLDTHEMSDKEALDRIALVLKVTNVAEVGMSTFGIKVLSNILDATGRVVR